MALTLTQARAAVRAYMDDASGAYATDTTADAALKAAQHAVYLKAVRWAPKRFTKEATLTTSAAGVATLTELSPDPLKLVAVSVYSSGERRVVRPASFADAPSNVSSAYTLSIAFIPVLTFPAQAADPFTWGQSAVPGTELLDELMCVVAASHLKMIEGETNAQLERVVDRMERDAQALLDVSGWSVMPLRSCARDSGLCYVLTDAATLQLVE